MRNIINALLPLLILFSSCRSTQKLFDKGNYTKAYYAALQDLKKNPLDTTASKILPIAYREAATKYEQNITVAKNSTDKKADVLDQLYIAYKSLQKMYDAAANINIQASSFSPKNYSAELREAAITAASARYNLGITLLHHHNKASAREAYHNFQMANTYVPGYKDVIAKKQQAYDAAITNIVVNKFDQHFGHYSINGNFFEEDIMWDLKSLEAIGYYKFYEINQGQLLDIRVDQFMDINMHDIWFSSLATRTHSYEVSKRVPVRRDEKTDSERTKTISATVYVTRRVINSRAVMDYRITDAASQRIIASNRIPAQYTWESITGRYTGDAMALSDRDRAIINGAANNSPGYDELYKKLTKQIMTQFNSEMGNIYR